MVAAPTMMMMNGEDVEEKIRLDNYSSPRAQLVLSNHGSGSHSAVLAVTASSLSRRSWVTNEGNPIKHGRLLPFLFPINQLTESSSNRELICPVDPPRSGEDSSLNQLAELYFSHDFRSGSWSNFLQFSPPIFSLAAMDAFWDCD